MKKIISIFGVVLFAFALTLSSCGETNNNSKKEKVECKADCDKECCAKKECADDCDKECCAAACCCGDATCDGSCHDNNEDSEGHSHDHDEGHDHNH